MKIVISNQIRRLRFENDEMTQRELAAASGVPQGTISSAETESRTPGIDVLLKLCRALGVRPDDLFERAGLLPAGEGIEEGFWELWGVWKRLILRHLRQDYAAEEREDLIEYAQFEEWRRG